MRRVLLLWLAASAIAASGCASDTGNDRNNAGTGGGGGYGNDPGYGDPEPRLSPEERRQQDWENQDGDDWFAYADGYSEGFEDGCDELFDAAGGTLYEEELPYEVDYGDYVDRGEDWDEYDCERLEEDPSEDIPFDVPDDPYGVGHDAGLEDGCSAIFEDEYERTLWSEDGEEIDVGDCELGYVSGGYGTGGGGAGGGAAPEPAAPTPTPQPVSACPPAGGLVIVPMRGKVDCQGAQALWSAWMERAPYEGTGSGGFLEIDGWGCISAPGVDSFELGSCTRSDGSAEFTVMAYE